MKLHYIVLLCITSAAISVWLTRTYLPTEIVKTEIEERERVVTVVKTIKRPDGTVEEESTKTENRITESEVVATKAVPPANWNIAATYSPVNAIYGLSVQRRVFGPMFIGAQATGRGEFSVLVAVEF